MARRAMRDRVGWIVVNDPGIRPAEVRDQLEADGFEPPPPRTLRRWVAELRDTTAAKGPLSAAVDGLRFVADQEDPVVRVRLALAGQIAAVLDGTGNADPRRTKELRMVLADLFPTDAAVTDSARDDELWDDLTRRIHGGPERCISGPGDGPCPVCAATPDHQDHPALPFPTG